MRRGEVLLALAGLILLLIGALLSRRGGVSAREITVEAGDCQIPVTILEPGDRSPAGFAVVLHGFSGNRRTMDVYGEQLAAVGLRVFLPDLPGHGDNSQAFSFPRAESCAANLIAYLEGRSEIIASRTILAGHSMGGTIAIRLANRFAAAGTIALSPAPMSPMPNMRPQFLLYAIPQTLPNNLLVLRGGLEPDATAEADRKLVKLAHSSSAIGGRLPSRWVEADVIPFTSHVGVLWDARVFRKSTEFAHDILGIDRVSSIRNAPLRVRQPVVGGALGAVGISCLFTFLVTLLVSALGTSPSNSLTSDAHSSPSPREPREWRSLRVLAHVAIASTAAVVLLNFWIPLRPLKMVTGDYLASFFLLTGIYLAFVFRGPANSRAADKGPVLAGTIAASLIVFGLGAWLNWRLDEVWMNLARWARFLPLALACLPYCLAEEYILGLPGSRIWVSRLSLFVALRLVEWITLVLAFFILHNGQLLIILLAVFLAAFSLLQRLGMDAVRKRTGSARAAAIFGAILFAWFLAAVLPLS